MAYYGPPPVGGFNPRWGRDEGIQPPHSGGAGFIPQAQGYPQPAIYGAPSMVPGYGYQQPSLQAQGYYYPPAAPQPANPSAFGYVSGLGGGTRHPQPYPVVDPDLPAANMTNSTGGVGCEPGYNYFFSQEHTKIHVLKSGSTPPWELPRNFSVPFHACHVPVSTTVGELLKGMGATNPVAKKNKVFEVVQGGNGKWYKGLSFNADDGPAMGKTLKEVGWDSTRSGLPGRKPVVYLYITKD
ncbi:hypothetical protein GE09DRAFT_346461 [Coniochaeta sp. 2T2.1]|nr:hypothetical protein GE09DRAFT_346461 [Coniochaeta sp. 2T2.1]